MTDTIERVIAEMMEIRPESPTAEMVTAWADRLSAMLRASERELPPPAREQPGRDDEVGKVWWLHKYTGETRYGCPFADPQEQALWMLAARDAEPAAQTREAVAQGEARDAVTTGMALLHAVGPTREEVAFPKFAEWFVKNYPGPDTIIHDPRWHAPKIWRAMRAAIAAESAG